MDLIIIAVVGFLCYFVGVNSGYRLQIKEEDLDRNVYIELEERDGVIYFYDANSGQFLAQRPKSDFSRDIESNLRGLIESLFDVEETEKVYIFDPSVMSYCVLDLLKKRINYEPV